MKAKHAREIRRGIEAAREQLRDSFWRNPTLYFKPSGGLAERAFDRTHDRLFLQWMRARLVESREMEAARIKARIRESARSFRSRARGRIVTPR